MKALVAIVATAAAVLCNGARADSISVTYDNPVWNPLSYDALRFSPNPASTFSYPVGASRYQATINSFTGSGLNGLSFVDSTNDLFIYCYDLAQYITHGQSVTYTV